jgi:hypothetical protein
MGENRRQRAGLIAQLASLDPPPESVPINNLVQVEGTPLHGAERLDPFEFVRTIAVARIAMPGSWVRLSAGRQELGEGIQALCFFAGANSIFYGDKLLTTDNPEAAADQGLLARLGIAPLACLLLLAALLAACSSVRSSYGDQRDVRMTALSFSDAYGVQDSRLTYAPAMDPKRKIAEQDCSKPVTLEEGNLSCR